MNIDVVAQQLKVNAPLFDGNVAGAAKYEDGVADQVWLPLPAAYVIPLDEDAGPNTSMNGLYQDVSERVGVIVVLETEKVGSVADPADRRGQAASAYLRTVRAAVFRAILNWRPDWDPANPATNIETRGIYYVGAQLLDFDRARFFYQFQFGLDTTITDDDGWVLPSEPLIEIKGTVVADGDTITPIDVTFPT